MADDLSAQLAATLDRLDGPADGETLVRAFQLLDRLTASVRAAATELRPAGADGQSPTYPSGMGG
jgi:hypothetical protein